jgi:hypothetical protein
MKDHLAKSEARTAVSSPRLLADGSPTGLVDSDGRMIRIGDLLRKPVECGIDFHGTWSIYRVKLQGIVPIIAYVESEKGKLLPEGYLAGPLSDEYDRKTFVFATDVSRLRPTSELRVVDASDDGGETRLPE